jgi:hypothetical protein
VSAEDLERYEADMELQLYQEYRDVLGMFQYVIETERRFYLANKFDLQMRNQDGDTYFDITLHDAWVWDMYRPARFVTRVRRQHRRAHPQGGALTHPGGTGHSWGSTRPGGTGTRRRSTLRCWSRPS